MTLHLLLRVRLIGPEHIPQKRSKAFRCNSNYGGISEMGSINSLSVTKNLLRIDELGNEVEDNQLVSNIDLILKLQMEI